MSNLPPTGWFPDPIDDAQQRYWDGEGWTEHSAPGVTQPPPGAGGDLPGSQPVAAGQQAPHTPTGGFPDPTDSGQNDEGRQRTWATSSQMTPDHGAPIPVPPKRLRLAWIVLAWRLPAEYRPWLADDIASRHFRWYSPIRLTLWVGSGAVIGIIVDDVVFIRPVWKAERVGAAIAFWMVCALSRLHPRIVARLRRRARSQQGLEGAPKSKSNVSKLVTIATINALIVVVAVAHADAVHAAECRGGGPYPPIALDGSIVAPPVGFGSLSPTPGLGRGVLSAKAAAAGATHPNAYQQILECNGFQVGYEAAWSAQSPDRGILIRIFEFSSPSSAELFKANDENSAWRSVIHATPPTSFPGDTTPPLVSPGLDGYGNYFALQFLVVDRFVVYIRVFRSDMVPAAADIESLIQAQADRLTAVPN